MGKQWFSMENIKKIIFLSISGGMVVFLLNISGNSLLFLGKYTERIDHIESRIDSIESRIDAVEVRLGNIEKSINELIYKIGEWQHQAKRNNDLFERFENKIWEGSTNR